MRKNILIRAFSSRKKVTPFCAIKYAWTTLLSIWPHCHFLGGPGQKRHMRPEPTEYLSVRKSSKRGFPTSPLFPYSQSISTLYGWPFSPFACQSIEFTEQNTNWLYYTRCLLCCWMAVLYGHRTRPAPTTEKKKAKKDPEKAIGPKKRGKGNESRGGNKKSFENGGSSSYGIKRIRKKAFLFGLNGLSLSGGDANWVPFLLPLSFTMSWWIEIKYSATVLTAAVKFVNFLVLHVFMHLWFTFPIPRYSRRVSSTLPDT